MKKVLQKLPVKNLLTQKVGILGIPFEKGQPKSGTDETPNFLRSNGFFNQIKESLGGQIDIKDFGDIRYKKSKMFIEVPNMKNYQDFCVCNGKVSEKVQQVLQEGRICLSIGGDHAIGLGTVHGHLLAKKDVCLLWVDAHADINTDLTSETGNTHGMPVAFLLDELKSIRQKFAHLKWLTESISAKNVAYIGLRSVDNEEKNILEKFNIKAYYMEDVKKFGIDFVTKTALKSINPDNTKSLHVSFDIDSLDPSEAPSTGTRVEGGLSLGEALHIMQTVRKTNRLSAIDVVEINSKLGSKNDVMKTTNAALAVITTALGYHPSDIFQESPGAEIQSKLFINYN